MPMQIRIVAILAAAVITASTHHRYLANRLETHDFVATSRPLRMGKQPEKGDLQKMRLSGNLDVLSRQFVPWGERVIFVGMTLFRNYDGGELMMRRDAEQRAMGSYQPKSNEYVFTVSIPEIAGLKSSFQIGSPVGFLITYRDDDSVEGRIEECGPFMLRQLGALSKQVDQAILGKVPSRSVTLSLPVTPEGALPALAHTLLNALEGIHNSRISGFYIPGRVQQNDRGLLRQVSLSSK